MEIYLVQYEKDNEPVVVSKRDIGLRLSKLQHILEILGKFPKRSFCAENQIFAVARYETSRGDKETMFLFGWGDKQGDSWAGEWWRPFFKISIADTITLGEKVLWEKVIKESLKREHIARVAIGCG